MDKIHSIRLSTNWVESNGRLVPISLSYVEDESPRFYKDEVVQYMEEHDGVYFVHFKSGKYLKIAKDKVEDVYCG